jgi:hypothetical protein
MVEYSVKQKSFEKHGFVHKKKQIVLCWSFQSDSWVVGVIRDSYSNFFGTHDIHSLQALFAGQTGLISIILNQSMEFLDKLYLS